MVGLGRGIGWLGWLVRLKWLVWLHKKQVPSRYNYASGWIIGTIGQQQLGNADYHDDDDGNNDDDNNDNGNDL